MAVAKPHMPVSEILRNKEDLEDGPKKKSREDWRKAKELEEARKAGTAPAAVDEEGKDINPHIPQYISSAPWYFGARGPTLKHQRIQPETVKKVSRIDEWYKRGVDQSKVATKYRKGACENCGAMTHNKKDCLERPRRIGAKYTNALIAADEFIQPELMRDFDGKRDRWAGYDPSQHSQVVERFAKIEEAKRQIRAEGLKAQAQNQSGDDEGAEVGGGDNDKDDDEDNSEEDEDKYADEVDMPGTKVDSKQRITVRNLRIREDTAKYLRNLDPNSAYYDPKTRSMRDNPYATKGTNEVDYAGENFVRFTGDTRKHAQAQLFAWEAYEKGVDVHPLGEPTKLELLGKEFDERKHEFKKKGQLGILDKYGGEEHLEAPPKELLLAQTEHYAEYNRYGTLIKGDEKSVVRSRYEEDVYVNNHTSVWGSYWINGQWGYGCCHSLVKGSYCTGEAGKAAAQSALDIIPTPIMKKSDENSDSSNASSDTSSSSDEDDENAKSERRRKKNLKKKAKKKKQKAKKADKKKDNEKTEEEKLKEALDKEEKSQAEAERLLSMDERKRPYNSMAKIEKPTDLEIEAYYMKKKRSEDPMADFI